ncbi:PR domain zinc finger protein 2 isoform X2 [Pleurodeles waltl]|uniref:PR domain zinc finger protein 2 isoform X2 n=1 Tax=Pleurodeles waltl TaxID=8319 RepID=UPI003709A6E8
MNQDGDTAVEEDETLADVPQHVFDTLPDEVKLFPSAVNKARLGVWTTKRILKGRKFGPFVGEKKKRSQVKSNVYMWEVYYPNLGWMCIDATDPKKGSWLRYVNWARSAKEQNLCPLEIKRAIYYKTLKPIEPGEELLVWYNGEDNPEIAAAIEEERAKHRIKRNSPKAKKGRRRSLDGKRKGNKGTGVRQRKQDSGDTSADMRDSEEGKHLKSLKEKRSSVSPVLSLEQTALIQEMVNQDALPKLMIPPCYETQIMSDNKPESLTICEGGIYKSHAQKEGSDNEDVFANEENLETLEKSNSTLKEPLQPSPKKKVAVKTPKIKKESNGDLPDAFMFPCQHCERKFTTKQGLERHMHIHVSSLNHAFKCRYCGKAFGTQINRRRHERRHEAGPKRKPATLPSEDVSDNRITMDDTSLKTPDEQSVPSFAQDCRISESEKLGHETPYSCLKEENMEPQGFHPCKYCKKVFGTHINMRRHQRRVHERHLIPKGVRRKGLLEEKQSQTEKTQPTQSVYTTSTEFEEDNEADDVYIMDVSNNISENLNYYIDGKIESTSSATSCEVIEVPSNSTEMYGINCLLAPVKIEVAQTMPPQTHTTDNLTESSSSGTNESKKRRTTSPPLVPILKTEVKAEPITPLCSLNLPLSVSVSDSSPFHKEKNVFLSSKLKQLLQTQEGNKLSPSLLTEATKLSPNVPSPILPAVCSRFKRRTSTPPSSPQHSPTPRDFGKPVEGKGIWNEGLGAKIPKLESHDSSPAWSLSGREERESMSPLCSDDFKALKDWTANLSFSSGFNQQPLDLSSGVKLKSEDMCSPGPWESVLDLSVHKKTCDTEIQEQKGNTVVQTTCGILKKKKPTTCMLQKVLLNEYNGVDLVVEDGPCSSTGTGPYPIEQQSHTEPISFPPAASLLTCSHILQIYDLPTCPTLPLLIPTNVASPLTCHPEITISTTLSLSPNVLTSLPEPTHMTPTHSCTSPPASTILSPLPEPSGTTSSHTCLSPPSSARILSPLPEPAKVTPERSCTSPPSSSGVSSFAAAANYMSTDACEPSPLQATILSSPPEPINVSLSNSCTSAFLSSAVLSSVPEPANVAPARSCTSPLSNSTRSPLPVLSPTASPSLSPVPSDDPSVSSPGPPTLSPSSSSDSSDSSDSSSCSSSPPPLSVASFVASPPSTVAPPLLLIKHEVMEEQVEPKENTRIASEQSSIRDSFSKNFVCNVCESPFFSIKELTKHLSAHAEDYPFKCEFCVQLFKDKSSLTEHRFLLHGIGKIFICSVCKKEFAFLCNLQQHQQDLHPDKEYTYHELESGTLRPQNFTDPSKANLNQFISLPEESLPPCHEEEEDLDDSSEELYTTIKIMASGEKSKDPDVRMGLNQHYPSFKPPPFQYHNRNPLGIGTTATNFTTHNIPQTFTTAIRCTKCGKSVDNMPELHKHILVCASASDKKRYTPKKNPVPLKQTVQPKNGLLILDSSDKNPFRRAGQPKKMQFSIEISKMSGNKLKTSALKKKNQLVHKAILQKKKSAKQNADLKTNVSNPEPHICPYCNREFTYFGSLNKHASYSCPKKPVSPVSKKNSPQPPKKTKKASSSPNSEKSSSQRRRTADAEIKMQSTESHLGKTRARSTGPAQINLPTVSEKPKQNVKYVSAVKSKKQGSPPAVRNSSPVRMVKIPQVVELKKPKTSLLHLPPPSSNKKTSGKLHVRVQRNKATLQSKSSGGNKKRIERYNMKSKKKTGGPITRSSQFATSTDAIENKKEDSIGKQDVKDLRNFP